MRRTIGLPFLVLGLFLFCWINVPKSLSDRLRSWTAASFGRPLSDGHSNELARLKLENQTLRTQVEHVYERIFFDQRIGDQFDFLKEQKDFAQKRTAHLRNLMLEQLSSLPAQVIYRDPSSWSSSVWVNVGEKDNRALGRTIVAKNSPVLADGAIAGVVDYVGETQARIRLITDSGLSPSVRVCRGATQNRELSHQLQALLNQVERRTDLFASENEKKELLDQLHSLQKRCGSSWEDGYLAKGEVHGSSAPFWRSRGPVLKGIGFNFDYPDEDGTSRDAKVPILKEGDLLVTSGLDGVFPPGIRVGTIAKIAPFKEGSYSYDIEVRPAASNLNDLQTLFILPSLSE